MAMRSALHRAGAAALSQTRISSLHRGRAHAGLPLRPTSPLPRAAHQGRADRRGPGGSFASLTIYAYCGVGQLPAEVELDIENTEFSPGVRRMQAIVGQDAPFDHGRERMKVLAGLEVTTRGCRRADAHPVRADGWDGSSGGEERDGRSAHTREVKLVCVFTQTRWDKQGYAIRDPDSITYTGAIESAEEFGQRIYAETWGRGWSRALQKVVIGDGAEWIWNLRPALSGRHADCRSLPRSPASLGGGSSAVPQ